MNDVADRITIEAVLKISAQGVAGEKRQGRRRGEIDWHGHQSEEPLAGQKNGSALGGQIIFFRREELPEDKRSYKDLRILEAALVRLKVIRIDKKKKVA